MSDVSMLFNELTNAQPTLKVYPYGHMSFIWGKSEDYIIEVIKIIENN